MAWPPRQAADPQRKPLRKCKFTLIMDDRFLSHTRGSSHESFGLDVGGVGSPFGKMSEGLPSSACGICNDLWNASQDLVAQNLFHPFVVALGSGVLPK